jgi:SAM-dependent methyltransferase
MNGSDYADIASCVACGHTNLQTTLDLGYQPLANDFLEPGSILDTYPLKLVLCVSCFHSQLGIAVDPNRLFRNYSYVSGTSATLSNFFEDFVKKLVSEYGNEAKVLDIGSNDGSFLEKFKKTNWNCIGIDPAINLIPESASRGVVTIPTFFEARISDILAHDFDVVVAMNVFAHTQNPLEILIGIKSCLSNNGKAFIQTSQANMFITGEFDTVYHEHISFFNVRSMKALLERAGLFLSNVSIVPIHGGSYLWEVSKSEGAQSVLVREIEEENSGLYKLDLYKNFARLSQNKANEVREIVKDFRGKNYTIVSYGAAAKGNTFINFAEINFDHIFDDTPLKIGRLSPAGGCVVSDPKHLVRIESPILVVIPAWNFGSEILEKIRRIRNNADDRYLTYFPQMVLGPVN